MNAIDGGCRLSTAISGSVLGTARPRNDGAPGGGRRSPTRGTPPRRGSPLAGGARRPALAVAAKGETGKTRGAQTEAHNPADYAPHRRTHSGGWRNGRQDGVRHMATLAMGGAHRRRRAQGPAAMGRLRHTEGAAAVCRGGGGSGGCLTAPPFLPLARPSGPPGPAVPGPNGPAAAASPQADPNPLAGRLAGQAEPFAGWAAKQAAQTSRKQALLLCKLHKGPLILIY